ncbi:NSUN5 [Scenedesmus sp. PABB004]|nr:NSUN5 [Scenedesmus sp. PABB004]
MPKVRRPASVLAGAARAAHGQQRPRAPGLGAAQGGGPGAAAAPDKRRPARPGSTGGPKQQPPQQHPPQQHQQPAAWRCASVIDQQAAEAVGRLLAAAETRSAGATIKSLTLAPHVVHKKPTFAVTCETLRHLPLLKRVLAAAGLPGDAAPRLSPAAAYVLTYELLFGEGFRGKGPAEAAVLARQAALRAELAGLLAQAGAADAGAWLAAQQAPAAAAGAAPHPRHARVNTLKASVAEVLAQLRAPPDGRPAKRARGAAGAGGGGAAAAGLAAVRVDELLPDLLVFPPGTDLHDHPLVEAGVLVLQVRRGGDAESAPPRRARGLRPHSRRPADAAARRALPPRAQSKASCMPAHALRPQPGWQVVDCCAAPGNKTTHVAALLHAACAAAGGESRPGAAPPRVWAFDKDPKRLKRLAANVARTGAGGLVAARAADFLSLDPAAPEFAGVRGVVLDPSCSGSGTVVSRMDHLLPPPSGGADEASGEAGGAEAQRVEQLAKFQEAALLHALRFPGLTRLVYSTCSVHRRENEDVVAAVLPAARAAGLCLADPFPAWPRRGLPGSVPGAELLVRTDPREDGTDGFFVAVFERQPPEKAEQPQAQQGEQQRGTQQAQQQQGEQQQRQPARKGKKKARRRQEQEQG